MFQSLRAWHEPRCSAVPSLGREPKTSPSSSRGAVSECANQLCTPSRFRHNLLVFLSFAVDLRSCRFCRKCFLADSKPTSSAALSDNSFTVGTKSSERTAKRRGLGHTQKSLERTTTEGHTHINDTKKLRGQGDSSDCESPCRFGTAG